MEEEKKLLKKLKDVCLVTWKSSLAILPLVILTYINIKNQIL